MVNDFKLPLVGLGICYCEFLKENPDADVRRHLILTARLAPREFCLAQQLTGGCSGDA